MPALRRSAAARDESATRARRARLPAASRSASRRPLPSLADAARAPRRQPVAAAPRVSSATLGISPKQYAEALRAGRLKALLKDNQPVTTALYEAGYGSSSRLYERTDAELGMTPDAYRRGGQGMHIHYVVVRSALGYLLVGATERGICSIKMGDAVAPARRGPARASTRTRRSPRDLGKLSPAVTALVEFVAGQRPPADLPLDVQGTAFQRRVWACAAADPRSAQTKSYGEVATRHRAARRRARRRAGLRVQPRGAGHSLPPGRGRDGATGGYHWGPARKERLLAIERDLAASVDPPGRSQAPARSA